MSSPARPPPGPPSCGRATYLHIVGRRRQPSRPHCLLYNARDTDERYSFGVPGHDRHRAATTVYVRAGTVLGPTRQSPRNVIANEIDRQDTSGGAFWDGVNTPATATTTASEHG